MVWRLCSRQVSAVAAAGSSTPIQPMRTTPLAFIVCPTCRRGEPRPSPDCSTVGHYAGAGLGVAFGGRPHLKQTGGEGFRPLLGTQRLKQDQCFIEVSAIADVSDIMDGVLSMDIGEASRRRRLLRLLVTATHDGERQASMTGARPRPKRRTYASLFFTSLLIQPPPGCLPRRVTGSVTDQTQKHHSRAVLVWQRPRCMCEVSPAPEIHRGPRGRQTAR
mgnify:CR=1 FL=1